MKKVTFSFQVSGNSQEELVKKLKEAVSNFFDINVSEVDEKVSYEMNVTQKEEIYTAEVVSWIKK